MAYDFVRSSSQTLSTTTAPATTYPFTIAAFARWKTGADADDGLVSLNSSAPATNQFTLAFDDADFKVYAVARAGGSASFGTGTTGLSADTWGHAVGLFTSSTSRRPYLNAVAAAVDTNSRSPTGIDRMVLGARVTAQFLNGLMAEVAIWDVALNDAEITSLSKGFSPRRIRPQSLKFYAPLIRTLQDLRGALTITNNNSATVAAHPRVY
jgi:hypothetical protein